MTEAEIIARLEKATGGDREKPDWWSKPGFREYAKTYADILIREQERRRMLYPSRFRRALAQGE